MKALIAIAQPDMNSFEQTVMLRTIKRTFDRMGSVFFFSIIPCTKLKDFNKISLFIVNCIKFTALKSNF